MTRVWLSTTLRSSFRIGEETAADDEGGLTVLSRRLTMTRVWLSTTLPFFVQNRRRIQLQTVKEVRLCSREENVTFGPLPWTTGLRVPRDAEYIKNRSRVARGAVDTKKTGGMVWRQAKFFSSAKWAAWPRARCAR